MSLACLRTPQSRALLGGACLSALLLGIADVGNGQNNQSGQTSAAERAPSSADREPASSVDSEYTEQLIEEVVATGRAWRLPRPETREWRSVEPVIEEPRVRMELGYDPEEELAMRRNNSLTNLDPDGVNSATVFRLRF